MSSNLQKDEQQAVLCDMCTEEERKPALKTCVKCEISMCVQHLQAHLTTPVLLQTHPLTEPMAPGEAGLGTTKCPQHGKILEYYCLDDLISVCVSCAIEDQHRLHNMKTLTTAHTELLKKLNAEQQALAKTEKETACLEKWEKSEREKLGQSSVRLIEAVSALRDVSLNSIQSSVSARMVAIKTGKNSIQAAQKEKDTFRFLQMYAQVHEDVEKAKVVDLRQGLEPGNDCEKLVQQLMEGGDKMEKQAAQLYCSLLTLVDPENHQEPFINSGLTFDPATLTTGMSLSEDHRKVLYSSHLGPFSSCTIEIKKASNLFSNWNRWTIHLSKHCDWTIGFCDKEAAKNLTAGQVYGLQCQDTKLISLTTEYDHGESQPSAQIVFGAQQTTEKPKCKVSSQVIEYPGETEGEKMARPETVEVFRNVRTSSLTFFSRSNPCKKSEILKIDMSNKSWDLFPFVKLKGDMAHKKQSQSQQQWKCQCDSVFNKNGNKWQHKEQHSLFMSTPYPTCSGETLYSTCSCGRLIGEPLITEVLCKLL